MKKLLFSFATLAAMGCTYTAHAQVKLGATAGAPDGSAILEMESTSKGFLPPRMTTIQRNNISNPATGLAIFNTTTGSLEVNTGTPGSPVWSSAKAGNTSSTVLTSSSSPAGTSIGQMMYNMGSVQPTGLVYWDGSEWKSVASSGGNTTNNYTVVNNKTVTNNDSVINNNPVVNNDTLINNGPVYNTTNVTNDGPVTNNNTSTFNGTSTFNNTSTFNKKSVFNDSLVMNGTVQVGGRPQGLTTDSLLVFEPTTKVMRRLAVSEIAGTTTNTTLTSSTSPAGTSQGQLMYNTGSVQPTGLVYWDGSEWKSVASSGGNTTNNYTVINNKTVTNNDSVINNNPVVNNDSLINNGQVFNNSTVTNAGPVINNNTSTFNGPSTFNDQAVFNDTAVFTGGMKVSNLPQGQVTDSVLVFEPTTKVMRRISSSDIAGNTKNISLTSASAPAGTSVGQMAYNTNAASGVPVGPVYWDGSQWVAVSSASSGWNTTGNSGTVDGTSFIGTTDNVPLSFKVNNVQAGKLDATNSNAFFGTSSGIATTGIQNAYLGHYAGANATTGTGNVFVGSSAGASYTTGAYNTIVGAFAGSGATNATGGANTIVGTGSGGSITSGSGNTIMGQSSGQALTTGSGNTHLGYVAGNSDVSGQGNIVIGNGADVGAGNLTNAIAIGTYAKVDASNSMVLGGTGTNAVNVGIGVNSPVNKLDVAGNLAVRNSAIGGGMPNMQIQNSAGVNRWALGTATVESGSGNAGADFNIWGYDDNGSVLNNSFTINRATGNVGIGTSSPFGKFNVDCGSSGGWVTFSSLATNAGVLFNANPNQAFIQFSGTPGAGTSLNLGARGSGLADLTINGATGNVGIGTHIPSIAKLHVSGDAISSWAASSIFFTNTGAGGHTWAFGARPLGTNGDFSISDETDGSYRMTIQGGTGNVGIGTQNPKAPLHIGGTTASSFTVGVHTYITGLSTTLQNGAASGSSRTDASIISEGNIWCKSSVIGVQSMTFSDRRIKNIIGQSDARKDLDLLNKIRITDYRMKDVVKHGNQQYKKVIAQEVEEVYPEAVTKQTGYVPNIYQLADKVVSMGNNTYKASFKNKVEYNQHVTGDLKLYDEKQEITAKLVSKGDNEIVFTTTEEIKGDKLFLFGEEVTDFRAVDYEALSTLNISATQELYREIQSLKKQNAELTASMENSYTELAAQVKALQAALNVSADQGNAVAGRK